MFVSSWLILFIAIVLEVIGIAFMRLSDGLSRLWPTVAAAVFYTGSVGLIVVAAETIGIAVTYAIWSGLGTALVAAMGVIVFGEKLTPLRLASITAIILGVFGLKLVGSPHGAADAVHTIEGSAVDSAPANP